MMERRIEHRDLGSVFTEQLACRQNALDVVGIMQRREVDAIFYALQHLVVDERRLGEPLAAMDHTMADRLNIGGAADLGYTGLVRRDVAHQVVQRRRNVSQRRGELLLGLVLPLEGDDRFAPGALDLTPTKTLILVLLDALQVSCNNLKLQAGTSGVKDKNIHAKLTFVGSMAFQEFFRG